MPEIKLGLPKGSLQEATFDLLRKAGWHFSLSSRSYYPACDDREISAILLRPQEMSRYVERGAIDAAITGLDWTEENGSDVEIVARLAYAKQSAQSVRWVLAVPENSPIRGVADLEGKIISTELVNTVRRYLAQRGVKAQVAFSHGATE
ncbi:MAG: ATP phosphoribosyltransferase, partial [Planctomycetota bacterium]|nr:ATP phosphoribosyltransferase [Planctomycetota bacterium]